MKEPDQPAPEGGVFASEGPLDGWKLSGM